MPVRRTEGKLLYNRLPTHSSLKNIKEIKTLGSELHYDTLTVENLLGSGGMAVWLFLLDFLKMQATAEKIEKLKILRLQCIAEKNAENTVRQTLQEEQEEHKQEEHTEELLQEKAQQQRYMLSLEEIDKALKKAKRALLFYRLKLASTVFSLALIGLGIFAGATVFGIGLLPIGLGLLAAGLLTQSIRYLYKTGKYAIAFFKAWRANDVDARHQASVKCMSNLTKFLPYFCIGVGLVLILASALFPPVALALGIIATAAFIANTMNGVRDIGKLRGSAFVGKAFLSTTMVALLSLEMAMLFIPGLHFLAVPMLIATAAIVFGPVLYRKAKDLCRGIKHKWNQWSDSWRNKNKLAGPEVKHIEPVPMPMPMPMPVPVSVPVSTAAVTPVSDDPVSDDNTDNTVASRRSQHEGPQPRIDIPRRVASSPVSLRPSEDPSVRQLQTYGYHTNGANGVAPAHLQYLDLAVPRNQTGQRQRSATTSDLFVHKEAP